MAESTRERVLKAVESALGLEVNVDETNLELDSLKMLELIVSLEQEFGIHIPEDAPIARITSSVDAIVVYVETNRNRSG